MAGKLPPTPCSPAAAATGRSSSAWRSMPRLPRKAKLFSGASDRVRRCAQQPRFPGRCRHARHAAGDQSRAASSRRVRTGLGLKAQDQSQLACSTARTTSIPTCRRAIRSRQYKQPIVGAGEVEIDLADGETHHGRHRAAAPRAGCRQVAARSASEHISGRSQPLGRGADGDRLQTRHALGRRRRRPTSRSCARSCAISAPATATWKRATCVPTSTSPVRRKPRDELGTRCEIKNVNSIRFIGQAIEVRGAPPDRYHRRRRQRSRQETRLFDPTQGETRSMRSKEEAHDYRYFPDPDLLPLELTARPTSMT